MQPQEEIRVFMTPDEVAKLLAISIQHVYALRNSGQLKGFRLSKKALRFERTEVMNFIERCRDLGASKCPE